MQSVRSRTVHRRQALVGLAAGGTAFTLSRFIPAAEDLEPLSFVIVSDTHLGRKDNDAAERNWRKAIDEINDLPGAFVLHLGDVVDNARANQYPLFAGSVERLSKPLHAIPGNHDELRLFEQHISKPIDRVLDAGGIRFVMFNNSRRDSHDGFISTPQIEWLGKQFADADSKGLKLVVCCHVPIHSNKHPDRGWYVKPNQGQTAFYELQRQYADRLLVCFHGHFHNGIRGWRDHGRTVETLVPSVCYNQRRDLKAQLAAGAATGFYVDQLKPGYLLATLGAGRLRLQYKPLGQDANDEYTADWT